MTCIRELISELAVAGVRQSTALGSATDMRAPWGAALKAARLVREHAQASGWDITVDNRVELVTCSTTTSVQFSLYTNPPALQLAAAVAIAADLIEADLERPPAARAQRLSRIPERTLTQALAGQDPDAVAETLRETALDVLFGSEKGVFGVPLAPTRPQETLAVLLDGNAAAVNPSYASHPGAALTRLVAAFTASPGLHEAARVLDRDPVAGQEQTQTAETPTAEQVLTALGIDDNEGRRAFLTGQEEGSAVRGRIILEPEAAVRVGQLLVGVNWPGVTTTRYQAAIPTVGGGQISLRVHAPVADIAHALAVAAIGWADRWPERWENGEVTLDDGGRVDVLSLALSSLDAPAQFGTPALAVSVSAHAQTLAVLITDAGGRDMRDTTPHSANLTIMLLDALQEKPHLITAARRLETEHEAPTGRETAVVAGSRRVRRTAGEQTSTKDLPGTSR